MATKNKYDRQLRLWGTNGQKALSESCVILINATSAGTETLKNLVLPGIGSFHIIDDQIVENGDSVGGGGDFDTPFTNFFVFPNKNNDDNNHNDDDDTTTVEPSSRAAIATKHLMELNPDVKGYYTDVPSLHTIDYEMIFRHICEKSKTTFEHLFVIASDLPSNILKPICNYCWDNPIPLVVVKSYGLIGTVRIQTPLHTIIESKPLNSIPDLRLTALVTRLLLESNHDNSIIFPELLEFIQSFDLSSLDSQSHGHVPFVIILYKAMEKWISSSSSSSSNDTKSLPTSFAEKQEFKKVIQSLSRNYSMELNFQEAVDNASLVYTTLELPNEVKELIHQAETKWNKAVKEEVGNSANGSVDCRFTSFDVLLIALKRFMDDNQGFPPLNGKIPDMTASSSYYIQLQNIYKTRAQCDKEKMQIIIEALNDECISMDLPIISDDELSIFCKNVYNLRMTKTRSYSSEYDFGFSSDQEKEEIVEGLTIETFDPYDSPAQTPLLWYIALRAADAFYDEYDHYPGKDSRALALESDAKIVQEKLKEIVEKMGLIDNELISSTIFSTDEDMVNAFAKEITRYYNAEIHNVASVIGGVASQEAVKLITKQYLPMNGTFVYNGIAGVPGVYQF